ncbi:MAG: T9SS type A sorting domain-containing protein [Bacteroidetes bacterium]|nr:T9SS type A sorting domain-containing protein [Bacteroidota bacterium]
MKKVVVFFAFVQAVFGWGSVGHKMINKNAVIHLPVSMQKFINQQSFFEQHASDPDSRAPLRQNDTNIYAEYWRHFLDVDDYPNFKNLTRSLDTLISTYGRARVREDGTNPWAVVWFMDSLTNQLRRGDWDNAYQTASDIGHYVADPHQPLHAARNYNGQETGNNGIHSRYESNMISNFQNEFTFTKDSVRYISDVFGFAFHIILESNALKDSVFHADNLAKAQTNGVYNSQYYTIMWQQLGEMTKARFQTASIRIASLWYTAWANAGLLEKPMSVRQETAKTEKFFLAQNYPNPFNPASVISYKLPAAEKVKLSVFDTAGKEIEILLDSVQSAGNHFVTFNAGQYASGAYFYRLQVGNSFVTKKMLVQK